MQVSGAGKRFIWGRTEAGLGRCGCRILVLHYARPVPARDHSLVRHERPVRYCRSPGDWPICMSANAACGGMSLWSELVVRPGPLLVGDHLDAN